MQKTITKPELISIINAWGQGDITTEKLQVWMLDNFEPEEVEIGVGEPEIIIEAMHIIMNEYELAKEEKCLRAQYQLAINFLNCAESTFNQTKSAFLRHGFSD